MQDTIHTLYTVLSEVDSLNFTTLFFNPITSKISGSGSISKKIDRNSIILFEQGIWMDSTSEKNTFRNTYKYNFDFQSNTISVGHFRNNTLIPLVSLKLNKPNHLISQNPHICAKDSYFLSIQISTTSICETWKVSGHNKNYSLDRKLYRS